MPQFGYKNKFKNIDAFKNDTFVINFNLKYRRNGGLYIKGKSKINFDIGDYHILIDEIFNNLTSEVLKEYDNGIYVLSVCKYLVDNIPGVYSIEYECGNMRDIYFAKEIIKDYKKTSKE